MAHRYSKSPLSIKTERESKFWSDQISCKMQKTFVNDSKNAQDSTRGLEINGQNRQ